MRILKLFLGIVCFVVLFFASTSFLYLKVLPAAIENPKVISYIENIASKALDAELKIEKPYLKTEWTPYARVKIKKLSLKKKNKELLIVENFDSELSLWKLRTNKEIDIKSIKIDNLNADISAILDLPPFKSTTTSEKGISINIFKSVAEIKNLEAFYQIDKESSVKIKANDIKISENPDKKTLSYNLHAVLMRDNHKLDIWAKEDGNNTIIENKKKLIIKNSDVKIDKTHLLFNGEIDSKIYDFNFKAKNFRIKHVIDIMNSQVVANNLSDYLVYFKNLDGDFNFDVNVNSKGINGKANINKIIFNLVPVNNLPVVLNSGKISIDNKVIKLTDFKGYYDGKSYNKIDFKGDVKDYLKSVDTDITANAVITNDFASKYLSKILSSPIEISGQADTRLMLKSKYGKMDLVWLYKFERGNGFILGGEQSSINNSGIRVLVAKMHIEDNILAIKSLDYYFVDKKPNRGEKHTPILSLNGNVELSGKIRDLGMTLTQPMPSAFVNLIIGQNLFRHGTFTGNMKYINTGKHPVLDGDFRINEVGIPSQRLFIKQGQVKTEKGDMLISANGGYRRSKYNVDARIKNEIVFPIIVRDANLTVDNMDVEKYLQAFNQQNPSEHASEDVNAAISKSLEKEVDEDGDSQTFDLANLIVEKCTLKILKGNYKNIHFADVVGNLTLDKNSMLSLNSNRFGIAEGKAEAKIKCDFKKHLYNLVLTVMRVNSDIIATELVNLPKEINGKASGIIDLNTDESLKLNGTIKFVVQSGQIAKMGLVEYAMKVAALFRNPIVMVTPSVVSDLVDVPEGKFDYINGTLKLERNVVRQMVIKSVSPQLSTYIVGRYNLDNQDAILRVYTKFSNRRKGAYGFLRSISLNSLANRIPFSTKNVNNYYEAEIKEIPNIQADEKDCQIFLTKVDGDIVLNNFISSLVKLK